jgi:hypothetical protein
MATFSVAYNISSRAAKPSWHIWLAPHNLTPYNAFTGMTMGYMANSYSTSNNGGSVNSQDSLWQMKMASAHHNQQAPPQADSRSQYGAYDPLTHGGYGVLDDYAQYPPRMDSRGGGGTPDAYSNAPPSRQDFGPPDKRLRQLYQGKFNQGLATTLGQGSSVSKREKTESG